MRSSLVVALLHNLTRPPPTTTSSPIVAAPFTISRLICSTKTRLAANDESRGSAEDIDFFEGLYFDGKIPKDRIRSKWTNASGPGGSNINKNPTKAEIRFNLDSANWIPLRVRAHLEQKHPGNVNSRREFSLTSQVTRYALQNMDDCYEKLRQMLLECSEELLMEEQRKIITPEYKEELEERRTLADEYRRAEKRRLKEKKRERSSGYRY